MLSKLEIIAFLNIMENCLDVFLLLTIFVIFFMKSECLMFHDKNAVISFV